MPETKQKQQTVIKQSKRNNKTQMQRKTQIKNKITNKQYKYIQNKKGTTQQASKTHTHTHTHTHKQHQITKSNTKHS